MNDVPLDPAVERVVVVGASLTGLRAVEAARQSGFSGELVLVGAEDHLPYDRPPLSKSYLLDDPAPAVPPPLLGVEELQNAWSVDVRLGTTATGLDPEDRVLDTDRGPIPYDRLLVATGVRARTLPGAEGVRGVHTLRTLADAQAIRAALDAGARTVVVGAGFIGSEVASAASARGVPVTVVEAAPTPLVRSVGPAAGAALATLHTRYGVDLRCGTAVDRLETDGSGDVRGIVLADGSVLPADLVVAGIGGVPATEWLTGSGVEVSDGVVCGPDLQTTVPGVFAAGDVARWHNPRFDMPMRVEHWTSAVDQGAAAMRNAVSAEPAPFADVPYFWSDWFVHKIQFVGIPHGEPTVVLGSWEETSWTALYERDGEVVGALMLDRSQDVMKYRGLIARRTSWVDALDFAERRRTAASTRRAAAAAR